MWETYKLVHVVGDLVYGVKHQKNESHSLGIQPLRVKDEMMDLSPSQLGSLALCLSNPAKKELGENHIFTAFVRDGARGHVINGTPGANSTAIVWLPEDVENSFLALIVDCESEDRMKHSVDLWGFSLQREGSVLKVKAYIPPRDYVISRTYPHHFLYDKPQNAHCRVSKSS